METPTMIGARMVAPGWHELASYLPVPGHGLLAVNAFVIEAREPVLVDTGLAALREPFIAALATVVDPRDIRWIWLSHMDPDHLGNLPALLDLAPRAQVVTNFLGMGKMMLHGLPVDRVHLLDPDTPLDVGDRSLIPLRPPYYDAPETCGLFDSKSRALFAADAFGALLETPAETAGAISNDRLRSGMATWSAIDAPWLGQVDPSAFGRSLRAIERLDPVSILSGHLPCATGMTGALVRHLLDAQSTGPIEAPDHDAIERLVEGARLAHA